MATLTETTYWTRKILKYGTITLISLLILKSLFKAGINFWRKIHPPPPPPPTVSFGKLPKLVFPEENLTLPKEKISFKLETIQGGFPKLPEIGKVYFMPIRRMNLLSPDRAATLAKTLGFQGKPEILKENLYRWQIFTPLPTTLEIEITNLNFHLFYDYSHDQELLTNKYLPTKQQAAQEIKNFLAANKLLPEDLANGTAEFEYFQLIEGKLVPTTAYSDADFLMVNLFRANLDELKVLPPNPKKSLIFFLFSGSRIKEKRIVEIEYNYSPIEREIFATYPLKPISEAWDDLQKGKGYIANLGENPEGKIVVRRIYLAYYETKEPQQYLQPIYVFEGDKNFLAYVAAIDSKWTE